MADETGETDTTADESGEVVTSPPKMTENGFELDGHGLPINHRLRAEALSDAGETEDPAGLITPELIEMTGERLAEERKATPPVAGSMKVADLERIAKRENIDLSTAKNNDERVALIESARSGIAPPPPTGTNEEPS